MFASAYDNDEGSHSNNILNNKQEDETTKNMLSGSLKERMAQLKALKEEEKREEEKKAAALPEASPAPVDEAPLPTESAAPGKNSEKRS